MHHYIELYGEGLSRDVISADSPKIEGIEGNRPPRVGETRRNPATIALAKFFPAMTEAISILFMPP